MCDCLSVLLVGFANSGLPPLCKHKRTRQDAQSVLTALCKLSPAVLTHVLRTASQQHELPAVDAAPTAVKSDSWELTDVESKGSTGFVGLTNLGCTCYMNSTLQQLFGVPQLRAVCKASLDTRCMSMSVAVYLSVTALTPDLAVSTPG